MVWGEEQPIRSSFPIAEGLTLVGLALLAVYLITDPVGRRALNSYEAAAQYFIDNRVKAENSVSSENVDVKEFATESWFLNPKSPQVLKTDFSDYANENSSGFSADIVPTNLIIEAPGIGEGQIGPQEAVKPLVLEKLDGTMEMFLNNEDNTLFEARDCSRSDELMGNCGDLTLDDLLKPADQ